jgi:hypothetical protein
VWKPPNGGVRRGTRVNVRERPQLVTIPDADRVTAAAELLAGRNLEPKLRALGRPPQSRVDGEQFSPRDRPVCRCVADQRISALGSPLLHRLRLS